VSQVLLIDRDPITLACCARDLRAVGYTVLAASSGSEGLGLLNGHTVDIAITNLNLPDASGLDIVHRLLGQRTTAAFVIVTSDGRTRDAVAAICREFQSLTPLQLHLDLLSDIAPPDCGEIRIDTRVPPAQQEAHAVTRWARALVPLVDSPSDPRTIAEWAHWVAVSSGTLRNWCRTARISARRSLVFGRMLRAVMLCGKGRHRPENLLDIVDRRTLSGMLRFAGFNGESDFPKRLDDFIERQTLVRDPETLLAIWRTLEERRPRAADAGND
jgi:CheY-like chemotaxis protein